MGSNHEKNWRSKISWHTPFKYSLSNDRVQFIRWSDPDRKTTQRITRNIVFVSPKWSCWPLLLQWEGEPQQLCQHQHRGWRRRRGGRGSSRGPLREYRGHFWKMFNLYFLLRAAVFLFLKDYVNLSWCFASHLVQLKSRFCKYLRSSCLVA